MSDFKKKASPKPKAVKEAPKKEAPKKEALKKEVAKAPKKPYREALADLKAAYLAAVAVDTKKAPSLRAKYKEDKKALKASY
jgi:hypothetical protein